MSGKGSAPRPFDVDQDTFAANWERIFSNREQDAKDGTPSEQRELDDKPRC